MTADEHSLTSCARARFPDGFPTLCVDSVVGPLLREVLAKSAKVIRQATSGQVRRRTRDRKVASSNPNRSGGRIFFSRVNFVCQLLFGVRSTPVLLQWHVKDHGHSAKSASGSLHLNTHTPLTQRSRSGLTKPLSRHSVGTYQETSSHAARQETQVTVVSAR